MRKTRSCSRRQHPVIHPCRSVAHFGRIDREKAAMGVLFTLHDPTGPMRTEVASAGFYASLWGTKHPRLQVLTVAELLAGRKVDLPPSRDLRTFKKAPKAKAGPQPGPLLQFGEPSGGEWRPSATPRLSRPRPPRGRRLHPRRLTDSPEPTAAPATHG
jgi:hypothetical protein